MKKIKIGQIGICHEHASGKINTLRKMPDVFEIVGVVDDRATTAARFAGDALKPYDGLKWMTEDELFNTPSLQAVTVETPNSYTYGHDYLVQEVVLAASGYTKTEEITCMQY